MEVWHCGVVYAGVLVVLCGDGMVLLSRGGRGGVVGWFVGGRQFVNGKEFGSVVSVS
jgi:hypothetical protein